MPGGGEPPQGMIALPNRYKAIVVPFGVAGAIIVEASPRVEDNDWLLDISKNHPVIVGLVGRIDPGDRAFPTHLERLVKNQPVHRHPPGAAPLWAWRTPNTSPT